MSCLRLLSGCVVVLVSARAAASPEVVLRRSGDQVVVSVGDAKLSTSVQIAAKLAKGLISAGAQVNVSASLQGSIPSSKTKAAPRSKREGLLAARRSLLHALRAHDEYTFRHSLRVSVYAVEIARVLDLSVDVERIRNAALLHDIGKLGVSRSTINSPNAELTSEQLTEIRAHPTIGEEIIKAAPRLRSLAADVKGHHERLDGEGYPNRLRPAEISMIDRIIAVADTFDAMTTNRSYRRGRSKKLSFKALLTASKPPRRSRAKKLSRKRLYDRKVVTAMIGLLPDKIEAANRRATAALTRARAFPVHQSVGRRRR